MLVGRLPIDDLPAGEYELRVTVTQADDDDRAHRDDHVGGMTNEHTTDSRGDACWRWRRRRHEPSKPPSSPDRPKFGTSTAAVVVDVIVRDKKGHPVVDLTKDDFEVFENGTVQTLIDFERVAARRFGAAGRRSVADCRPERLSAVVGCRRRRGPAQGTGRHGHRLRLAHRPVAVRGVEGRQHAARPDGAERLRRRVRDRPGAAAPGAVHAGHAPAEGRVRQRRHAAHQDQARVPTGRW